MKERELERKPDSVLNHSSTFIPALVEDSYLSRMFVTKHLMRYSNTAGKAVLTAIKLLRARVLRTGS